MDFIKPAASRIQMSSSNSQNQQAATTETTNSNATVEQHQDYVDKAFKITNSGLISEQQEKISDARREAPGKSTETKVDPKISN